MITITIKTDNAAFEADKAAEVGRILHELADKFETGEEPTGPLLDFNGNTCGAVTQEQKLKTETFDFAMQTRVCDAFKASKIFNSLDVHHINAVFEHGQWWIIATLNSQDRDEITYSVVDATGGDSVNGFDFEEV